MSEPAQAVIGFVDRKEAGRYPVLDADGATIASIKVPWYGGRFTTQTPAGELLCRGDAPVLSRDWAVTDASGRAALRIATTAGGWSFHPDAYLVKVIDPRLTLAHVIGVVQANRLLVKQARSSS